MREESCTQLRFTKAAAFDNQQSFDEVAFKEHASVLKRYLKPDLLNLGRLGRKQLPQQGDEFLFEAIMPQHELPSAMMTSDRPLVDWGNLIGNVAAVPVTTHLLGGLLRTRSMAVTTTGRPNNSARLEGGLPQVLISKHCY